MSSRYNIEAEFGGMATSMDSPDSPIRRASASTAGAISELLDMIGALEDRLQSALRPESPEKKPDYATEARIRDLASPLAADLQRHQEQIAQATDRLCALAGRIEL